MKVISRKEHLINKVEENEKSLARIIENNVNKYFSSIEKMGVISGVIAPLSLMLIESSYINKALLFSDFTIFMLSIILSFVCILWFQEKIDKDISEEFELGLNEGYHYIEYLLSKDNNFSENDEGFYLDQIEAALEVSKKGRGKPHSYKSMTILKRHHLVITILFVIGIIMIMFSYFQPFLSAYTYRIGLL